MKKKNKNDVMRQKLGQWKKSGFSVEGLIRKVSVKKDVKGQVSDWKKKGFDTSVLKK